MASIMAVQLLASLQMWPKMTSFGRFFSVH
jgi:hypothetical protein